jgi:hypothetical protein
VLIAFVTTCKNRTYHLRQTLPRNLDDNPDAIFVVLDYGSPDGLRDYVRSELAGYVERGTLVVYSHRDAPIFHMAHAKNMAARCAMREGADVLVTLDADNYAGYRADAYLAHKFGVIPNLSFLCPDVRAIPPVGQRYNGGNPTWLGRGFMGRLAMRTNDFVKLGGYNETYDTWRGEDIDLLARARRLGLVEDSIDSAYLNAISHDSAVRFSEYPHAQQYENDDVYSRVRLSYDTVVNYGNFGCGTVYRNFVEEPIRLAPIPTRVFGVGMQRTGTSSLCEALRILGHDSAHWESGEWARAVWQEMNMWGRSRTLERFYAACDNPIPLVYRWLDEAYPNSKFVLTVRDEGDWVRSVERLWSHETNPRRWTWDSDGFSHRVHSMIYGQPTFDRDAFLERYRQHNAEVMSYFRGRPRDLLVMDMTSHLRSRWPELCGLLGVDRIPDVPYPSENGTDATSGKLPAYNALGLT